MLSCRVKPSDAPEISVWGVIQRSQVRNVRNYPKNWGNIWELNFLFHSFLYFYITYIFSFKCVGKPTEYPFFFKLKPGRKIFFRAMDMPGYHSLHSIRIKLPISYRGQKIVILITFFGHLAWNKPTVAPWLSNKCDADSSTVFQVWVHFSVGFSNLWFIKWLDQ